MSNVLRRCSVNRSPFVAGSHKKRGTDPRAQRRFLTGLGIGAVFGLLLTGRVWKRTEAFPVQRRRAGVGQVPSVGIDADANRIIDALKEHCNEMQNQLASAMADLFAKLPSLQESEERWVRSLNEYQRSVTADLRRLQILVTWTVILSCFGVVSFAIVLYLAYVKF
jgi:hypothetical protein